MAGRRGQTVRYKVVLCGQFGVGKTSVMRRFVNDSYVDKSELNSRHNLTTTNGRVCQASIPSTLDCYCRTFSISVGHSVQLELWDTAGLERFRTLSASYYADAAAALVCYAVDDRNSFQEAADYVVEALDVFGRSATSTGAVVFLCGNKTDLASNAAVSAVMAETLANEYDHIVCRSYRVSCKTGDGVKAMFDDLVEELQARAMDKADRTATIVLTVTDSQRPTDTICSC